MMLSVILLSMPMILLSIVNVIKHLIWGNKQNRLLNLNLVYETLWTGAGSSLLIAMLEKLNWFHFTGQITLVLLIWKQDGSVLEESSFKMLRLAFSSKLNQGTNIISIAKTASKKIEALICSMKFLSPEIALYLYKSTIHPCFKYCCNLWAGAPQLLLGIVR